jgi:Methyltransferase domain
MQHRSLPIDPDWDNDDSYVSSLLSFATSSDIFRNLCGGIHILDFLTREPDLYNTVLPRKWRDWFDRVTINDVLDLLLREDLQQFGLPTSAAGTQPESWRGHELPPSSLIEYVHAIRRHCFLRRHVAISEGIGNLPRHIAVGMKPKKIHEVSNFAAYIDKLSTDLADSAGYPVSGIVDFGSGQNYLGRTLASPPYNRDVIAIERHHHNIDGAKGMDIYAKLATKQKIMRNKKEYKKQLQSTKTQTARPDCVDCQTSVRQEVHLAPIAPIDDSDSETALPPDKGSMTYIEHEIQDGWLENVLNLTLPQCPHLVLDSSNSSGLTKPSTATDSESSFSLQNGQEPKTANLMIVSLHSCGNLVHHGLRSLILNPSVSAVAMIGCCYNLMTERLGPPTYKLPTLRSLHPRLESTSTTFDPHGFPMSKALENFEHKHGQGVRLNITARMMAVQAPYNWGPEDSEAFFKRHFYRALLQRILLDRGVVKQSSDPDSIVGGSISGKDNAGTPLIVGALRKPCFESFRAYVRGALAKLSQDPADGPMILERTSDIADEAIERYESEWAYAKKNLSVIWSLMAFSAGVVESIIAVDRWLFLREQKCVEKCWVEPVFDYALSPRNLVVVGLKKRPAAASVYS